MPDKEQPQDQSPDNPPSVQYIQPPSILPPESHSPQVITKIIEQPSLSHAIGIEVRDWVKSRIASFGKNLKADITFCRDAFVATFKEGRWRQMIAALGHAHKLISWVLGSGLLALMLSLYVFYVYPVVGRLWTALIVLSVTIFGLVVTIRVARKLYEKNSFALGDAQKQIANADTIRHQLEEKLEEALRKAEAKYGELKLVRRFGIHWDAEQNPLCPVDDTFLSMTDSGVLQATGKYFEVFHCPKCKTNYQLRDDKGNPVRIGFAKERVRLKY